MKPIAISVALTAGLLGALTWGLISYFTNYEIGYVAWAIGGLVGYGSYALGGRNRMHGIACAIIAFCSILAGKLIAIQFHVSTELEEVAKKVYQEQKANAAAFAVLKDESDYAAFMVKHNYTEAKNAKEVANEELEEFKSEQVPQLKKIHEENLSHEAWRNGAGGREFVKDLKAGISMMDILKDSLGAFDIIFALLGIGTAFKVASREDGVKS